jgi:hypothetical protein
LLQKKTPSVSQKDQYMSDKSIEGDVREAIADIIRNHIADLCTDGSKITVIVRDINDDLTIVGNDSDIAEIFAEMSDDVELTVEPGAFPGNSTVH